MEFIPPLYANMTLKAPPGSEGRVVDIMVRKGPEYLTAFVQFSEEELAEIQKTGGAWVSIMSDKWPPLSVEAFIPRHTPINLVVFGEDMLKRYEILQYLDFTLVLVKVEDKEQDFAFHCRKGEGRHNDQVVDIWDLTFKTTDLSVVVDKPIAALSSDHSVRTAGKYLFGAEMQILGRWREIPTLEPLKLLFPAVDENWLVLAPMPVPPRKIIQLYN